MAIFKKQYILLEKEYDPESCYDLGRDVDEALDWNPLDEEYKKFDKNFMSGTYYVKILYVPGEYDKFTEEK